MLADGDLNGEVYEAWMFKELVRDIYKLRHSVASTLAYATALSPTSQLIVTTYENSIARQLAADTPDSQLINIRANGTN
jgi:hypothetical protein